MSPLICIVLITRLSTTLTWEKLFGSHLGINMLYSHFFFKTKIMCLAQHGYTGVKKQNYLTSWTVDVVQNVLIHVVHFCPCFFVWIVCLKWNSFCQWSRHTDQTFCFKIECFLLLIFMGLNSYCKWIFFLSKKIIWILLFMASRIFTIVFRKYTVLPAGGSKMLLFVGRTQVRLLN